MGDEAEPLTAEHASKAQPLIQVFGEQIVRKLFSRTWQLREEGLGDIENLILRD
jgi:hypothetical protein